MQDKVTDIRSATDRKIDRAMDTYTRITNSVNERWLGSGSTEVIATLMLVEAINDLAKTAKGGSGD